MWTHTRTSLRHSIRLTTPLVRGTFSLSVGAVMIATVPAAARAFSATALASEPKLAECTRWLVHDAWSGAARECPTPLVLLRTPRLTYGGADAAEAESFRSWADMFASRGYTAVEVDVSVDPNAESASTEGDGPSFPEPIKSAKTALNAQLRLLNIPFAPVVIASGPAGLVAQAYVSDHPASGLVLVDPPADEDPRDKAAWAWPKFNYEPRFPILLVPTEEAASAAKGSRVGAAAEDGVGRGGQGVSIVAVEDGVRGEKTRMEIERWMDRCGF